MSVFTGDIVDGGGNAVDCEFRMGLYNHNKVSNVRSTELTQFNIDSDDADLLDGGAVFAPGDTAIIHFYTDTACAIVKVISDGSDSYVFNVQLRDCVAPTTTLSVSNGTINNAISASSTASDEYQWDYEGTTHYHKTSWFGETWCTGVGIATVEYDFGAGYTTSTTHTFTVIGDYEVSVKTTNICGLPTIDSKTIRVIYNTPIVQLSCDPSNPKKDVATTMSVVNTDVDTRILGQVWYVDDVETVDAEHSFSEVKTHEFKVITTWDDGFGERVFTTYLSIPMVNEPPKVTLSYIKDVAIHTFTADIVLGDGSLSNIAWQVFYELPISKEYVIIYSADADAIHTLSFENSGIYRVKVTVRDSFNTTASAMVEVPVAVGSTSDCGSVAVPPIYFDKE